MEVKEMLMRSLVLSLILTIAVNMLFFDRHNDTK